MIFVKKCDNCGIKFQTSRKNQKFCSEKCRSYFRKKITIIVAPARPIKIETKSFGRKTPIRHRNIPSVILETAKKDKKSIEKYKKTLKKLRNDN